MQKHLCPTCNLHKTESNFMLRSRRVPTCKRCRRRESNRKWALQSRQKQRLIANLALRRNREDAAYAQLRAKMLYNPLKSRYLKLTSVCRSRIKQMEAKQQEQVQTLSPQRTKTDKALIQRRQELALYTAAYKRQIEMADAGYVVPDILKILGTVSD